MYILDATDEQLQMVLAAAAAANALEWNSAVKDWVAGTPSLTPVQLAGTSNGVTDVDVATAPGASTQRQLLSFSIYNKDTAVATVTVKHDKAGTERIIVKASLQVGDSLHYEDGRGWYCTDPWGNEKKLTLVAGSFLKSTTYTSGTSHTTDSRCGMMFVRLLGGGGAGGGVTTGAATGAGGGGGSSGGYLEKTIVALPNTAYTYAIGAAGAAASGLDGGDGGDTTFAANGVTYTAGKGLGGKVGTAAAASTVLGGAAPAVGTNGDVNGSGEPGSPAFWITAAVVVSGKGASSLFGGGGNAKTVTGAGNDAIGQGAGGGGAVQTSNGGASAGGAGQEGMLVVEEYAW